MEDQHRPPSIYTHVLFPSTTIRVPAPFHVPPPFLASPPSVMVLRLEFIVSLTPPHHTSYSICLLYTSDAADEEDSVDLGGRRIIKKKKKKRKQRKKNKSKRYRNN
eukprot:TRINITY_DN8786_c0_g1_i1.p3 TRINITY_DN8786_c0_g1~~TRINITY_DN8786_c0_g1_i1.p3  ORF type:complete len:106 (-),score=20.69 TRINITY_DN8786_c0_g1_i1:19-336(-)